MIDEDVTFHDEYTLRKAEEAIMLASPLTRAEAGAIINEMLNAGLLIRERAR